MAKLCSIDEITVMCQSKRTLYIVQYKGLCIFSGTAACSGITYMSYPNVSIQALYFFWVKFLWMPVNSSSPLALAFSMELAIVRKVVP